MMLLKKQHYFTPPQLQPGGTALLGTKQKVDIDNTWPIEEILIFVDVVVNAQLTNTGADSILGIVKNVELSINDNNQPRSIVNCSGVGLLEYASLSGFNLDADTLQTVILSQAATVAAAMAFRICYRIPLVHPAIGEPLRTRCLLPVHTWNQQPKLTIDFEQGANMFSAGSLTLVQASYTLIRRNITQDLTNQILADGGFLNFDLLETPYQLPLGTAGEVRLQIPTPGSYTCMAFRQYLGGATVTRNVVDQTGKGDTVANGFAAETRWRLESGGVVNTEWRWNHLRKLNCYSRPLNSATQSSSPQIGGIVAANTSFSPASSTMIDFLDDGVPSGGVNELGSVLDLNIPARSGLKMELIGNIASVATNASQIFMVAHRFYGDLSKWQAAKVR